MLLIYLVMQLNERIVICSDSRPEKNSWIPTPHSAAKSNRFLSSTMTSVSISLLMLEKTESSPRKSLLGGDLSFVAWYYYYRCSSLY
jgi:hypothetical protein